MKLSRRAFLLASTVLIPGAACANFSMVLVNGSAVDPWAALDGRAGAPAGTPQFPTVLNGYPTATPPNARIRWPTLTGTQPQWEVAGVDYPVGIDRALYPTNANLKDPLGAPTTGGLNNTLVALGGSYNAGNGVISFSGVTNAVVDGWDFSLHNGLCVAMGQNNMTVSNNNFVCGSNGQNAIFMASPCQTPTITKNIFDGAKLDLNGRGTVVVNAELSSPGSLNGAVVTYNHFLNAYGFPLQVGIGQSGGNTACTIKYNLFEAAGWGAFLMQHGDVMLISDGRAGNFNSVIANFNAIISNDPSTQWASRGIAMSSGAGVATYTHTEQCNNTVTLPNAPVGMLRNIDYVFIQDGALLTTSCLFQNNYVDTTGVFNNWDQNSSEPTNDGLFTVSGNVNMLDGSALTGI